MTAKILPIKGYMLILAITILLALTGITQTNFYSNVHDDDFDVQSNEAEQRCSCQYYFYSYQFEALTNRQINKSKRSGTSFLIQWSLKTNEDIYPRHLDLLTFGLSIPQICKDDKESSQSISF